MKLKNQKKKHYASYFNENKNNMKKIWDGIRSIVNIKNTISPKVAQINDNGKIIDTPEEIASTFNDFFANVGPNTERDIPKAHNISPNRFLKNRNQFDFIIAHISNEEVLEIINSLENKSTGPNSIPVKLLILIPDLIITPLCHIINMSFLTGIFPDKLKIAKVIPIHKGGSSQDVNNFRPISLLSIFDKIMEKLMHKRLYAFLEHHDILFENQFGFRKNNSTAYALLQITERIKESIDNGKFGCAIFIDLRKAFDTVNHDILISKLEHYGIRGELLNWFHSYLNNRKQYVFFNGESSELRNMNCGVPQGSVLGPLLFLIYINDLPNVSKILNFYLFADDTNIYYESADLQKLENKINKELKKLYLWLNVNRLSLNTDKTNFTIFHPYNKPLKSQVIIKIQKNVIVQKDYIKYLGVIIDSTLTWKNQIKNIANKISRAIGVMYKLRPYLNMTLLKSIYYSLIYSHIVYAIQVWGSACDTELNKILILQKRVVRLITHNDKRPILPGPLIASDPLFVKLDLLKVKDIFIMQISKFIFNCLKLETPNNFRNWFKFNCETHDHKTRLSYFELGKSNYFDLCKLTKSNNLFIHYARTTHYGLKLIRVSGPKIWNSLPLEIRNSNSINLFKKDIKEYLMSLYIET